MNLKDYIADVEDFPKKGILFRDITPLMSNGEAFSYAVEQMYQYALDKGVDVIVGPEARGFIFGCPVANKLNVGFVPIRKPGKLPREALNVAYDLEYGQNVLSMHKDAIKPGQKVLIVDDLLATGGTLLAGVDLVEKLGGVVCGIACLIELVDLEGREKLNDFDILTLIQY